MNQINTQPMQTYMRWLAFANVPTTTLCCSCVIPCGFDSQGLPFGIQIMGRTKSDCEVLSVAGGIENLFGANPETLRPVPDFSL